MIQPVSLNRDGRRPGSSLEWQWEWKLDTIPRCHLQQPHELFPETSSHVKPGSPTSPQRRVLTRVNMEQSQILYFPFPTRFLFLFS